ncbi:ribonuclease HII [Pontivivens nitratireducens]|jgi:ribonuclease HII|uniref:ribonuclease HII n=1 Tax=Pontivivens nitratireducens TaxID=2758038 RepID=UPI001639B7C7|nr:ribonuclease HII [Pontibrevibacter nitratireducens]
MTVFPDPEFEARFAHFGPVCGVDEVGRGPWAGPVVTAAVILGPDAPEGLRDSKTLSLRQRNAFFDAIMSSCQVAIGRADLREIEELNILQASLVAMSRAVSALKTCPAIALIDGNKLPRDLPCRGLPVVKGDAQSRAIAAASIVAKVTRDREMVALAQQFPGYAWETNMGYGTKAHRDGLSRYGVTPHHRRGFAPIHKILVQQNYSTR